MVSLDCPSPRSSRHSFVVGRGRKFTQAKKSFMRSGAMDGMIYRAARELSTPRSDGNVLSGPSTVPVHGLTPDWPAPIGVDSRSLAVLLFSRGSATSTGRVKKSLVRHGNEQSEQRRGARQNSSQSGVPEEICPASAEKPAIPFGLTYTADSDGILL